MMKKILISAPILHDPVIHGSYKLYMCVHVVNTVYIVGDVTCYTGQTLHHVFML